MKTTACPAPTRSLALAASPIEGGGEELAEPEATSPSMGEVGAKRREGV
jgi:hypothetical protein